jgi:hypothetical protein
VLTALTAAAAVFAMASAVQADPQAPGSFTGYGFDTCKAPSSKVMDAWGRSSPFSAVGIYISGNSRFCGDDDQENLTKTWVTNNANHGWRFIPIHVGYQSPCFKNNPNSSVQKKLMSTNVSTARSQARSDAKETIAALEDLGFPSGSASYLDLEWYSRTDACDNIVLEFIDQWTETLHANDYLSGVYSSGSAAIKLLDETADEGRSGFNKPDHLWFAWTNGEANVDGGSYLSDDNWSGPRRIHQYSNGKSAEWGGQKLTIDWDWLHVGKGSKATKEPSPCGVKMSFTTYPLLKLGSERAEVKTLQCLLKQRGYSIGVTGKFGETTATTLDKFRATLNWEPTGHTTRATWTALLSAGKTPFMLKSGSAGEAVWRVQRALRASGAPITINGLYGSQMVKVVQTYRGNNGLTKYQTIDASVWAKIQHGAAYNG